MAGTLALQRRLHQRFAVGRPDAAGDLTDRLALLNLAGQIGQLANFPCHGPEYDRHFVAFTAQAIEDAQAAGAVAAEHGVGQGKDVVAGAVGNRLLHGVHIQVRGVGEQNQLFDFLVGGQQVALYTVADELQDFRVGTEAFLLQALAQPAG